MTPATIDPTQDGCREMRGRRPTTHPVLRSGGSLATGHDPHRADDGALDRGEENVLPNQSNGEEVGIVTKASPYPSVSETLGHLRRTLREKGIEEFAHRRRSF